jgi:hypothetical protein
MVNVELFFVGGIRETTFCDQIIPQQFMVLGVNSFLLSQSGHRSLSAIRDNLDMASALKIMCFVVDLLDNNRAEVIVLQDQNDLAMSLPGTAKLVRPSYSQTDPLSDTPLTFSSQPPNHSVPRPDLCQAPISDRTGIAPLLS